MTAYSSAYNLPTKKMTVVSGPAANFSVRFNHTDVKTPDFTEYRKERRKSLDARSRDAEDEDKFNTAAICAVGGAAVAYAAKSLAVRAAAFISPSADVMALSKIEIDRKEIAKEEAVDVSTLRDPEPDNARVKDKEWLIVVGICTHLGCVPIPNQGDWNGYYCPCHGSHYDASGRIRKGPAPTNLEVPPYEFIEDKIIVG
ncbi:ubiquinol-cytochrome c reductase iron-sulfur subunit, putative [Pediculus humanus corporis]|uniref:Cytochrome b-c1 complex subunit Rieske, mitochondrial n=1 Tax=Pediculus humanus subsp. corporis TaxID=121224 RepID=E0VVK7_PEDHC|nr:ubiquinol-cytochrome c reductase iron-sulfur subunit, putative [Pediculus humanus corporis]EEB17413.1 ubiquinol-cytochrome c reductase iron-sulfur subunit, putative [Pediculus humanus corporis]